MKKILVIEDEELLLEPLCELLRFEKFAPIAAQSGEEGLDKARSEHPDLILCDVMLPGMDGYTVLQKLREDASTASIPVIFLTALAERWNMRKGMETGADDYLGKPVLKQELLAAIRTQLEKRKANRGRLDGRLQPTASSDMALVISQQLLAPLTAIVGFGQTLSAQNRGDSLPQEKINELGKFIMESGHRLEKALRQVLDYVSIRVLLEQPVPADRLRAERTRNAGSLVESAAGKVAHDARRFANLKLDIQQVDFGMPQRYLELVTRELVQNAFDFSRPETPVKVTLAKRDNAIELSVTDQGTGMSPEQIQAIGPFRQFARGNENQQGLGLGLEIVRLTAAVFGANLRIESRVPEGTTVAFRKVEDASI
jgi:DNA-binding response OmpR family regulator/anti-sigma regulatory factor (Ser/Thr protein kinase)